jgi:hypothetical protein
MSGTERLPLNNQQTEGNDADGPMEMHHSEQEAPGALSTAWTAPMPTAVTFADVSIDDLFGTSTLEVHPRGSNSNKRKTRRD